MAQLHFCDHTVSEITKHPLACNKTINKASQPYRIQFLAEVTKCVRTRK